MAVERGTMPYDSGHIGPKSLQSLTKKLGSFLMPKNKKEVLGKW